MGDKSTAPNGQDTGEANAAGIVADKKDVEKPETLDAESLMKRVVQQESTIARLLDENKRGKSAFQRLKEETEQATKKTLEEQGQFKPLYEKAQSTLAEMKEALVREKVMNKIQVDAQKHGVVDMEALFTLGNKDLIKYEEESESVIGVDLFLEDAKKRRPYLFNATKTTAVNTNAPGGATVERKLTPAQIVKLRQEEKNKVWADAFKKAAQRR